MSLTPPSYFPLFQFRNLFSVVCCNRQPASEAIRIECAWNAIIGTENHLNLLQKFRAPMNMNLNFIFRSKSNENSFPPTMHCLTAWTVLSPIYCEIRRSGMNEFIFIFSVRFHSIRSESVSHTHTHTHDRMYAWNGTASDRCTLVSERETRDERQTKNVVKYVLLFPFI